MIRGLARICFLALVLALFIPPAARAQQHTPAPLQERMSYAEFMRLGLNKLSPAELQALNAWLKQHGETGPSMDAGPQAPDASDAATKPDKLPNTFHTHIVGAFHGWESGTKFKLANGLQIQTMGDSELMIHSMDNPGVTLRKGFLGGWLLNVDGVSDTVHVKLLH